MSGTRDLDSGTRDLDVRPSAYDLIPSLVYVSALSLWALVSGHWSAWQAARVEVAQQEDAKRRDKEDYSPKWLRHCWPGQTSSPCLPPRAQGRRLRPLPEQHGHRGHALGSFAFTVLLPENFGGPEGQI